MPILNTSKIIVAGPCAAESKEQLLETAKQIAQLTDLFSERSNFEFLFFRAGLWKPRTNPGDFQGAGNDALPWLQEIQEKFGFRVCVEVASAKHVQLCMESKVDAVWIGARTTVNPFLVQEIADAVQGSTLTVLVKNPVNPDVNLWAGAIQRFQNAGIKNVMAIHRGFSIESENVYRNTPCWEIPIALKMRFPELPLLCDVAHIAGDLSLPQIVAQTALNYGFDGLMAELHHAPETALSDRNQQLRPAQFAALLKTLTFPLSNHIAEDVLFFQRNLIKNIDIQISKLLSKRMEVVDEIAAIKAQHALPAAQPDQWKKVVALYEENALNDEKYRQFLEEFLLLLHKSSLKRQE